MKGICLTQNELKTMKLGLFLMLKDRAYAVFIFVDRTNGTN